MISSRPNLIRLSTALAVLGLALAACGSDGETAGDALSGDIATSTTTSTTATTTTTTVAPIAGGASDADEPAPTTTTAPEPASEPASEPAPEPAGGGCLVGDWKINDAEMNSYYDALAAGSSSAAAALSMDTTGEVLLSFTDTTYAYVGDFELMLSVAGLSGTGVASGTADGTWTADGDILRTELADSNLSIIVTVGGVTRDGSELGNGFLRADPLANTPYSCDGPTLMFQAGPTEDIRHPVVLTPA